MKRFLVVGAWLLAGVGLFSPSLVRAADEKPDVGEISQIADLIIYNAKVLTVNSNFTVAKALAIRDGRIIAVGKERQLEEYRGPETRVFDAQEHVIMPGLYDADVHSYTAAVSELGGAQPFIDSITNAQAYIRKQATNKPAGAWIVLSHIYPTRLKEGRMPTKEELDAATTNHPVYWDFGTLAVVNSKALEVSGITKDTQAPNGGEIVKEPKHLKPTGLLRNASSLLKLPPAARPPTPAQERAALKKLYALYNQQGITSIGESDTTTAEIDLFRAMSRSNELTVRINCARLFEPSADADESTDRLATLTNVTAGKLPYGPTGVGDDWVRIGALQTVLDGDINMGTAYLRTPYGIGSTYMISELAYRGVIKQDSFALPQVYLAAAQQGWQLSAHASGDAALDFLLNSYEQVQFKLDIRDRRFVIDHTDFQAAQDWSRCQKLGLGVVLDPGCLYQDGPSLERTLGTNRLTYFAPYKGWFDRGIVAGAGSGHDFGLDSVVSANAWNPWLGMWVALTRQTREGTTMNASEQLTREQVVRLYTYNNAWLKLEDKDKGTLEPGKLADLVMLDTDITKCPVDEVRNTKVMMTMVNGKIVWQAIDPIFPGPQVIPTVTVIVTNVLPSVAATTPATATPAKTSSTASHKTGSSNIVDPYAPVPVPDVAVVPVPTVVTTVSSNANIVATTTYDSQTATVVTIVSNVVPNPSQPAAVTNTPVVASTPAPVVTPAVATAPATPATQTIPTVTANETKSDNTNTDSLSGIAGAAPAELAPGATPAAVTTPAANSVPTANTSIVATNEAPAPGPSIASTATFGAQTNNPSSGAPALTPARSESVAKTAPIGDTTNTVPGPSTTATPNVVPLAPKPGVAAVNPVTTGTNADPSVTAAANQVPTPAVNPPVAVAKATVPAATTTTNQPTDPQDWSHLGGTSGK